MDICVATCVYQNIKSYAPPFRPSTIYLLQSVATTVSQLSYLKNLENTKIIQVKIKSLSTNN